MIIKIEIDKKGNAKIKQGNKKAVHLECVSIGWDFNHDEKYYGNLIQVETYKKFFVYGKAP